MSFGVDPTWHTVHFHGVDYGVTTRPEISEFGGRWWWLMWDDTWFRVGERQGPGRTANALVTAWLEANTLDPAEHTIADEKGPAWTATEASPTIVERDGRTYRVYAKHSGGAGAGVAAEGSTHWYVDNGFGARMGPEVDVDDTVAQIVSAIKALYP